MLAVHYWTVAIIVIMRTVPVIFPCLRSLEVDVRALRTANVVSITKRFVEWKRLLRNMLLTILADDFARLEDSLIRCVY